MRPPLTPIPPHLQSLYRNLRIALFVGIGIIGISVLYSFLFPTFETSFDFRNPKSSRNQIFDPRSESGMARSNGKLEASGTLIANSSPLGDFSHLSIDIDLEKKSESPEKIGVTIKKNYRAFLYPIGEPVGDFPTAELYRINDVVYTLTDGRLHRFVSESAFRSRFPADSAKIESVEFLTRYPIAPDFIGFRIGSLISFADGIYVVTSDTELRPIGSAEIFLALGYSFNDVIPVDEEAIGIYKRGKIFLMGNAHPDGTIFEERLSQKLYLIESGTRRQILNSEYADFLRSQFHPILALEANEQATAHCDALTGLLPRTLSCETSLDSLANSLGSDYELQFTGNNVDIDITRTTLAFDTRLDANNASTLAAKVKQRLLSRFGMGQR